MKNTLGQRIASLRKEKGLTQDELATSMGVSAQAVSKWENDISCPDIMLLPQLAGILGVTTDTLLSSEKEPVVAVVPEEQRKDMDKMMLRVRVNSHRGDKVNVNLPVSLIKVLIESGVPMDDFCIEAGVAQKIDFEKMFNLIDKGVIGKLVEVNSADGDTVEVFVE